MKKIIVALVALLVAFNVMAQEHLTFKGIPIEGSMTEFCKKLQEKGFVLADRQGNLATFSGDFTGRNAIVGVGATDDGKSVYSVVVLFDESREWNTLVNAYSYFKDLYPRKYGDPAASIEKNPASSNSNTSLMWELSQGTVSYTSLWKATGGEIDLFISKASDTLEGRVVIRYRDSQNAEAKTQKDLDDI